MSDLELLAKFILSFIAFIFLNIIATILLVFIGFVLFIILIRVWLFIMFLSIYLKIRWTEKLRQDEIYILNLEFMESIKELWHIKFGILPKDAINRFKQKQKEIQNIQRTNPPEPQPEQAEEQQIEKYDERNLDL